MFDQDFEEANIKIVLYPFSVRFKKSLINIIKTVIRKPRYLRLFERGQKK